VEIVPEAIQNAKENAKINNISNAEFFVGAAEDVVEKLNDELTNRKHMENSDFDNDHNCDVVVVDPPRKGCDEVLLKTVISMSPKSVVYVSCDPATLARDVKFLLANGYSLKKICPVDQFCHSGHVETVCLLTKK
jgi:23S rRNA (uracil1939-C5)-methyltransferase